MIKIETAERLAGARVKVKLLEWSEIRPPNEEVRYDHVVSASALGQWSIEWKSWKDYDDRTIFLDGDFVANGGENLEAAKAAAQADYERRIISALAEPAGEVGPVAWRSMESAPKNGTMLRLLVRPGNAEEDGWTPFADSIDPYQTIGFNPLSDTGEDEWQFAGWDWCHDCFTDGAGDIIGWLPFDTTTPDASAIREAASKAIKSFIDDWGDGLGNLSNHDLADILWRISEAIESALAGRAER